MTKRRAKKRRTPSKQGSASAQGKGTAPTADRSPQHARLSIRTWQAIAACSAVVGLITGYFSLLPRVSVRPPSAHFQMASPFMSPFVVVNDGVLPVWNVQVQMYTGTTLEEPYDVCDGRRIQGTYSTASQSFMSTLTRREEFPFYGKGVAAGFDGNPLPAAAVITLIDVQYTTIWLPWRTSESFVFDTIQSESDFIWTAEPAASGTLLRDTTGRAFTKAVEAARRDSIGSDRRGAPCRSN
jgi:hypothetical protein